MLRTYIVRVPFKLPRPNEAQPHPNVFTESAVFHADLISLFLGSCNISIRVSKIVVNITRQRECRFWR